MKPILTVHGVKVYGILDRKLYKDMKEVEKVTSKEEWRGIRGIYCAHNLDIINHNPMGVYFAKYEASKKEEEFCLEIIINKRTTLIRKLPIIVIDTNICRTKEYLQFTLLHELGHHVDETQNPYPLEAGSIECEMMANRFSVSRCGFLNVNFDTLLHIPLVKEAIEEMGYDLDYR
ncbi:hypothetical protein WKH56_20380 [Priestia sp. SB1]|uniref:ImmA/IrrE family metallo-endopeptidase n=1 Tax=Priestia sp. SB1 TaxID=3132359 RepID=UPI003180369D